MGIYAEEFREQRDDDKEKRMSGKYYFRAWPQALQACIPSSAVARVAGGASPESPTN
jgi:hypothetical protein